MGQGQDVKLNCQTPKAHVKIEVNTTTRGILFPERIMLVTEAVQNGMCLTNISAFDKKIEKSYQMTPLSRIAICDILL